MLNYIVGKITYRNSRFMILESNWTGFHINIVATDNFAINQTKRVYITEILKIYNQIFLNRDLYGFSDLETKLFFNTLQKVDGIGPRTALVILKNGTKNIIELIKTNNINELSKLQGLDLNLASEICTTLSGKNLYSASPKTNFNKIVTNEDFVYTDNDIQDTLLVLGYHKDQIQTAISLFKSANKNQKTDISTAVASCIEIIMGNNNSKPKQQVASV